MELVEQASLQQYLSDVACIAPISHDELCALAQRIVNAQASSIPHFETLVKLRLTEGYLWLVAKLVKRSSVRTCLLSKLDLLQEGAIGLMRAIERYDYATLHGDFASYVATFIKYAILDALPMEDTIRVGDQAFWRERAAGHTDAMIAMQPLSLDALYKNDEQDARSLIECVVAPSVMLASPQACSPCQEQTHARVQVLLARLTPREQVVIRMRFGLDEESGQEQTYAAIGQQLGLDDSTVYGIVQRALRKMRAGEPPQGTPRQARAKQRHQQYERFVATCSQLEAQGHPLTVHAIAKLAHLDKQIIQEFLRAQRAQQGTEEERLLAARAQLDSQGCAITAARLCALAKVSFRVAAAFLRAQPPAPKIRHRLAASRPARPSQQERLLAAWAQLEAQGKSITRARLRKLAGVSTDAARAFLRAQRSSH